MFFPWICVQFLDVKEARDHAHDKDLKECSEEAIDPININNGRSSFKQDRQKLRGHLAKVYAMHWSSEDSR